MKKSLQEKISEIKEALEKEDITRQEINNRAEHCAASRIQKGLGITEKNADKLLSKIQKIRVQRKNTPKSAVKIPCGVKEIEIESVIDGNTNKLENKRE